MNNSEIIKDDWLLNYSNNIYSQRGEDGIIQKIFEVIGTKNKWCVEFGAWDGVHLSNTCNLIKNFQWSAVFIEAQKSRFEDLVVNYRDNKNIICLNRFVDFKGINSLDNILSDANIPKDFDLLSIDIDGNDYHVWETVIEYSPRVVIIEFNPTIPTDIDFIQPKDFSINQGSSLLALYNLGLKKGYQLISVTLLNAIFVKSEFYSQFNITNNQPSNLFKDTRYLTRLFQLYDGTVVLHGCNKLMWHGIPIDSKRLQFLPKIFRYFPEMMSKMRYLAFRIYRKIKNSF